MFGFRVGESCVQNLLTIVNEAQSQKTDAIDWRQVVTSVVKTQPPRAVDVPEMEKYVRLYSGMPTGSFMRELNTLLKHRMPSTRIVSGHFFKLLADIKIPLLQDVPAHLINAVLFTHASNDYAVHDGIARFITKQDISQLASDKKKADVNAANDLIKRAKTMIAHYDELPPRVIDALADLMVGIVTNLLGKTEEAKKKKAQPSDPQAIFEKLAQTFAKSILGDENALTITDEQQTASASSGDQVQERKLQTTAIHYNEYGETCDLKRHHTLNQITLGAVVMNKKDEKL